MKYSIYVLSMILLLMASCKSNQTAQSVNEVVIELDGVQSMSITGKGPGQDGAINPYINRNSKAIVTNMGNTPFDARIERQSGKVEIITIKKSQRKEIILLVGEILYFDSDVAATAKVAFAPYPA